MQKNNSLSQFTNLFPVSKTLRFELIPQGETKKLIEEVKNSQIRNESATLLETDIDRRINYEKYKLLIDNLHRWLINKNLHLLEKEFEKKEGKASNEFHAILQENYLNFKRKTNYKGLNELVKIISKKFAESTQLFESGLIKNIKVPDVLENKKKRL